MIKTLYVFKVTDIIKKNLPTNLIYLHHHKFKPPDFLRLASQHQGLSVPRFSDGLENIFFRRKSFCPQGVCDSTSCLRQTAWRREGSITSPTAPPLKWCRINKWRHINKQCRVTNRRYITNARPVTGGCLVSIGRRVTKRCYQTAPSPCGATSPMAAVFPLATESRNGVTKRRHQTTSRHVRPPCH